MVVEKLLINKTAYVAKPNVQISDQTEPNPWANPTRVPVDDEI